MLLLCYCRDWNSEDGRNNEIPYCRRSARQGAGVTGESCCVHVFEFYSSENNNNDNGDNGDEGREKRKRSFSTTMTTTTTPLRNDDGCTIIIRIRTYAAVKRRQRHSRESVGIDASAPRKNVARAFVTNSYWPHLKMNGLLFHFFKFFILPESSFFFHVFV